MAHRFPSRVLRAGALATVLAPLMLFSTAASEPASPPSSSDEEQSIPTMVILDASGSMVAEDGNEAGDTRMDVAKQAVHDLVDAVDSDAQLGLTIYGSEKHYKEDGKDAACQDVKVAAEIGSDPDAITSAADAAEPLGHTPIGESLRVAADALPDDGPGAIVLVSDGEDTCAPPPACEVAEELAGEGIDTAIHTIGFRVDDKAREELSCIADKTGGSYSDAQDGDELSQQLQTKATRSMQGYEIGGTPIQGGENSSDAPSVEPGLYLAETAGDVESFSDSGAAQYFKVDLEDGERVHASATMVPESQNRSSVGQGISDMVAPKVEIVSDSDAICSAERISPTAKRMRNVDAPIIASTWSEPVGTGDDSRCAPDGTYIKLTREGSGEQGTEMPVELKVAVEKAGQDDAGEEQEAQSDVGAAEGDDPGDVTEFGTSFENAIELEPGSYAFEMVPGDYRVLSMNVDEGQQLKWSVKTLDEGTELERGNVAGLDIYMYDQMRNRLTDSGMGTHTVSSSDATEGGMPATVNRGNRESSDTKVKDNFLGGEHFIELNYGSIRGTDTDESFEPARFVLNVEVDGESQENLELTTEGAAPENSNIDEELDTGDNATGGDSEGSGDGDGFLASISTGMWIGLGIGLVVLLAIVALVIILVVRKSGSKNSQPPHQQGPPNFNGPQNGQPNPPNQQGPPNQPPPNSPPQG